MQTALAETRLLKHTLTTMEELLVTTRQAWRDWLEANHDRSGGVWLVFYKKHTGRPSLAYRDALEEALCFGWVDSLIKRIDADRYKRKLTPRIAGSNWSKLNKDLATKLLAEGRVAPAGLSAIDAAKASGEWDRQEPEELPMPAELDAALATDAAARAAFDALAPSHRRRYLSWISDAKREDTRRKRSGKAVAMLKNGEVLGI